MKRLIPILLALCILFVGCGEKAPADTTPQATTTVAQTTPEPTTTVPETTPEPTTAVPETTPPPTGPLLYQHPLTGQMLAEPMTNRPVAVVINNISVAQPLYGIGAADILYEMVAEGGGTITRLLAVFTDLTAAGNVGSIRSARTYLIDVARAYDAPLVHCGGSLEARNMLGRGEWINLDEMYNSTYFYRSQYRINKGYPNEHTLFSTGENLLAGLKNKNYRMTLKDGQTFGLEFAEDLALNGQPANALTVHYYNHGKTTTMTYNPETGCYEGLQKWTGGKTETIADTNTDTMVGFKNVLVLSIVTTQSETATDGIRVHAQLTGDGTGYFACNGQYVPIKWHRASILDPFTYTLEDGTPLTLGVGKTYVALMPHKGSVDIQ